MLDAKDIKRRYSKAKGKTELWQSNLQNCYELTMPNRANFDIKEQSKGSQKTLNLYDPTATLGLKKYASNLQSMLFGVKNWAKIKPTNNFIDGKVKSSKDNPLPPVQVIKEKCEEWTTLLFKKINASNFQQAVYQSLMEMGISTGILLVNMGDEDEPFNFTSIPLSEVSLDAGPNNTIQNVYREYKVPAGVITQTWPKAVINSSLQARIDGDPSDEIEILEGTIYKPELNKYIYFVMEKSGDSFIFEEPRDVSPWIVFRPNVLSGELFGRGPIYDLLPFIKELNQSMEFITQAAGYNAKPTFLSYGAFTNPNTARLASGSIISVKPSGGNRDPVSQLKIEASSGEMMQLRQELIGTVEQALNLNPIGDTPTRGDASQTATEANLRNQDFIKQMQAIYNRIEYELVKPVISLCWEYMFKLGMVTEKLGKIIYAEYDSPIMEMSAQQEIQKIIQSVQQIEQIVGPVLQPYAPFYEYDPFKVTKFISEKNNVSFDVIRDEASKQGIKKQMQSMEQGGQQQPGQQQQQQPAQQAPANPMQFIGNQ